MRTPYANKAGQHTQGGAEIRRDEVPVALQPMVQQYFEQMVKPRLDPARQFIGPVRLQYKRELLARARCLLVTSLVPETSSLAALEALAATGTPPRRKA